MKKGKLESKMLLIALASILFISCGGGGGGGSGGGASNLPINPGTPLPINPGIPLPTNPKDFQTGKNPLDNQKNNMPLLKSNLNTARENSGGTIPSDTRTLNGNGIRLGILDSDFTHPHEYNQDFEFIRPFKNVIDVGRASWDTNDSVSPHGEQVLEVLMDRSVKKTSSFFNNPLDYAGKSKAEFSVVGASIGIGGTNKDDKRVEANLTVYRKMIDIFLRSKEIKIFNQSWGSEDTIKDFESSGKNVNNLVFNVNDTDPYIVPFFKDAVNNKGGLFIWAGGNKPVNDVTFEAGLPYFSHELEKGWIAAIGITPEEMTKDGSAWSKVANGKLNIHRPGSERLAYAGEEAMYWAISADDRSMFWPNSSGYSYGIGSSFAAPRVTRAAALVSEKFDWMTADQIRQTLFTTTDDTEISSTLTGENRRRVKTSPDKKYGWGMLNQERALKGPGAFMNISKYGDTSIFKAEIPSSKVSYFENKIFGSGGLIKSGEGTLHLTNDNSYTGGSIVNAGILEIHKIHSSEVVVNTAGKLILHPKTLIGYNIASSSIITTIDPQNISTNINLTNKGKVEVNGSTAIIGGDYIAYKGSTTTFNSGAKLNILGDIKVQDAIIKVMADKYTTAQGESSTLMEGNSFEGNIANVETNGMRVASVEVQDGKVVAEISRQNPINYIANAEESSKNVAQNVENVLQNLDQKVMAKTATEEEVLMGASIQAMSTTAFSAATEKMSGEIYASSQALTFTQSQNINRDLSNRLANLDNLKLVSGDVQTWVSAIGSNGKLRRNGYASADTHVIGGQFGIDKKINNNTNLGIALAYSYANADFNRYAGEAKSNMVGLSLYGKKDFTNNFYTAGRIGLSHISTKVERELIDTMGNTVQGDIKHDDVMTSLYIEAGKKFTWFTPFIGYSHDYLRRGSFSEDNAAWGIHADSKNYWSPNFLIGLRAEFDFNKYKFQSYITQSINVGKRDLAYEGHFTGSTVKQKFYGIKQAKNTTWLGLGVFREITANFGIYGNIDFRIEDGKRADSVFSTGLKYKF